MVRRVVERCLGCEACKKKSKSKGPHFQKTKSMGHTVFQVKNILAPVKNLS